MSCCSGKSACHENPPENKKDKGCTDHSCPSKDCHFQTVNFKLISESNFQELEVPKIFTVRSLNEFYISLTFKDLSYSFWHPPKYIS